MDQWQFDPTEDLDLAQRKRVEDFLRPPGLLVCSMRSLAAGVLRCWLRIYHRLTIVGRENLPANRSFILIANHASHLDTLCLLAALPMSRLHRAFPAAARDYFCVSAARAFFASVIVNALPFDRHFAPWQSLSVCAHMLSNPGNIVIFFPEGTRLRRPGAGRVQARRRPGGGGAGRPRGAVPPRRHSRRPAQRALDTPAAGDTAHHRQAAPLLAPACHQGVGKAHLPRAARGGDGAWPGRDESIAQRASKQGCDPG